MTQTFLALRTLWPELDVEVFRDIVERILDKTRKETFISVADFTSELLTEITEVYGKPALVVLGFTVAEMEIMGADPHAN
jgi:hypothetical protein